VDYPLGDRRQDPRYDLDAVSDLRTTLRPGCPVSVVDLSAGGALVEGRRPLRPGARVHLQMRRGGESLSIAAHILRCFVWAVDPADGVRYRGALRFEQRCDLPLWEGTTPAGSALPRLENSDRPGPGQCLPAASDVRAQR